jgi:hypothetical protein
VGHQQRAGDGRRNRPSLLAPGHVLEIDNVTAPNPLPALFGIDRPAYPQAKRDYLKR